MSLACVALKPHCTYVASSCNVRLGNRWRDKADLSRRHVLFTSLSHTAAYADWYLM